MSGRREMVIAGLTFGLLITEFWPPQTSLLAILFSPLILAAAGLRDARIPLLLAGVCALQAVLAIAINLSSPGLTTMVVTQLAIVFSAFVTAGFVVLVRKFSDGQAAALTESQREKQELQFILDAVPAAIFYKDREHRLIKVNAAQARFLGLSKEQIEGKTDEELGSPHANRHRQHDLQVMSSGEPIHNLIEPHATSSGTRWLKTEKIPLRNESGKISGLIGMAIDITDYKLAEEKLRDSERDLAYAQRIAQIGSWTLELSNLQDVNQNTLHWSEQVFRIFGYEPGEIEASNSAFFRHIPPEDRTRIIDTIQTSIRDGTRYQLNHRIILPDGTERIVREESDIIYDEATGRALRMAGTIQDVTDREWSQRMLAEQKRLLERIAAGTELAVVLTDLTLFFEQQFPGTLCSVLILDSDQRLRLGAGPSLPDSYHKAIDGLLIGPGQGSCGTAAFRREMVVVEDISTDPLWAGFQELARYHNLHSCWSTPIKGANDDVLGTFAIYGRRPQAPTERQLWLIDSICDLAQIAIKKSRMEDGLRQNEIWMRAVLESSLDCIVTIDEDWHIVEFNHSAERTFGYARAEVIGGSMLEILVPPDARAHCLRGMDHYRATGESPILNRRIEVTALRADGTHLPMELSVTAVRAKGTQRFTAFLRDISERKRAEAALVDKKILKSALQSAENLFRNLVEYSLVGIHIIQDGRFAYVNPRLAQIFGFTPGELLAMDSFLEIVSEGERAMIAEHVRQQLNAEVPFAQYEFRGCHQDGHLIDVEVRGSPTELNGRPAVVCSLIDITERKGAESALRESEERFRNAFEHTNVPMVLTNLDHRLTRMNPAFNQLLGYSTAELLEMSLLDLIHADDLQENVSRRTALVRGELPYFEMDTRYRRKDGRVLWARVNVSLVRNAQGQPQSFVGQVQDITESKLAEDRLRASEARFSTIFRSSPVGICITTMEDGRFIDVNDAFLSIVGDARDDVLGRTAVELGYLQDPANREKLLDDLRRHGSVTNLEHTFTSRNGTIRHALRSLEVITLDGRDCILTLLNDITERKQAEELLSESERRLRLTTTSSNTGLWDWNLQTNQVYFSSIWKRQIGYADSEIPNKLEEWKNRVHPDDLDQALANLDAYLRDPVENYESEFRFRHKDQSFRWILAQGRMLKDDQGRPQRLMGSHIDITDHKRAETKLKQTADRLGILLMTAELLGSTLNPDDLLNELLTSLTRVISAANFAAIFIYDPQAEVLVPRACAGVEEEHFRQIRLRSGEAISGRVLQLGRPLLTRTANEIDAQADTQRPETRQYYLAAMRGKSVRCNICAPLNSRAGEVIGTLSLGSLQGEFTDEDLSLLEAIAAQTSIAIQNADLFNEVRSGRQRLQLLSRELMSAQEAERAHIARELHDEIGQVLTAVGFHLHNLAEKCGEEHRPLLEEDVALVDRAIQQVRDLSLDLRPPTLDLLGLEPTLRAYLQDQSRRTGLQIQIIGHLESRLPSELEITCYRFVQGTLTNVIRHARAQVVRIELKQLENELQIEIRDDGVGFDVAAVWQRATQRGSFGLMGMQERVQLLGGQMTVQSELGQGTLIKARFPLASTSTCELIGKEQDRR